MIQKMMISNQAAQSTVATAKEFSKNMRARNNSPIWRKDKDSSEDGANTIKIISDRNLDVAPGITIKKLEITYHSRKPKPKQNNGFPINIRRLLKLKHTRPLDPDQ
jgi:hypothetical protein